MKSISITASVMVVTLFVGAGSSVYANTTKNTNKTLWPVPMNSAWVYDNVQFPNKPDVTNEGSQAVKIKKFNMEMGQHSGLNALYTYGGDIEIVNNVQSGSGWHPCTPSDYKSKICPQSDMKVDYNIKNHKGKKIYNGEDNAYQYSKNLKNTKIKTFVPILDGRSNDLGVKVNDDYLQAFNVLNKNDAEYLADQVSQQVCGDPHVSGIQFDLEPFNINKKPIKGSDGQYYFYNRIAMDFAGKNSNLLNKSGKNLCTQYHKNGLFFSVFTFSKQINPRMASVFNTYHNGYVVDSLYDLGPNNTARAGLYSTLPSNYAAYVNTEATAMKKAADANNVPFQFGIPVSASVHEFNSYSLLKDGTKIYPAHSQSSKPPVKQVVYQSQYLANILKSSAYLKAKTDPLYIGNGLWAFDAVMPWIPLVKKAKQQRFYYPANYTSNESSDLQKLFPLT